jgi:SsrA-binding protein
MEYIRNKKATFEYSLEETIEAGIELLGTEVKSVKANHGSLSGAYVAFVGGDALLLGAHIPAWQEKNVPVTYDPYRTRKLLLHKREMLKLSQLLQNKGLTIVPISLYNNKGKVKLSIAIAKGKKLFDKRNTLKERAMKRDSERDLS